MWKCDVDMNWIYIWWAKMFRIKWIALFVLVLSLVSLIGHLSKSWTVNLVQYDAMAMLRDNFASISGRQVALAFLYICICKYFIYTLRYWWLSVVFLTIIQSVPNKRLWGVVKPLMSLQPYANPRSSYPGNNAAPNYSFISKKTRTLGLNEKHFFQKIKCYMSVRRGDSAKENVFSSPLDSFYGPLQWKLLGSFLIMDLFNLPFVHM